MNKIRVRLRIGIMLSVLWLFFVGSEASIWDYGIDYYFMEVGVLPLVIFWGLVWIISGFRNKDKNTEDIEDDK